MTLPVQLYMLVLRHAACCSCSLTRAKLLVKAKKDEQPVATEGAEAEGAPQGQLLARPQHAEVVITTL
jgi:hypothetical protein